MKLPSCPAGSRLRRNVVVGLLAASLLAGGCHGRHQRSRPLTSLSEPDRAMLQQYEAIRASLAKDDARSARRTAANFQKESEAPASASVNSPARAAVANIAAANTLEAAREAFRAWSTYVIALTRDVEGFYVIHCPVPGCGDWLQTDPNVDNPFMGKSMRTCGEVEK